MAGSGKAHLREPAESILHLLAHHLQSAPHAADQVEPAVQVDHAVVAGGLMEPIDVLGQNDLGSAHHLKACQGPMGVIRDSPAEPPPSDHAPRPIAPARCVIAHEGLVGDGLRALPVSIGVAIVRNAGICAAAGPRQDE